MTEDEELGVRLFNQSETPNAENDTKSARDDKSVAGEDVTSASYCPIAIDEDVIGKSAPEPVDMYVDVSSPTSEKAAEDDLDGDDKTVDMSPSTSQAPASGEVIEIKEAKMAIGPAIQLETTAKKQTVTAATSQAVSAYAVSPEREEVLQKNESLRNRYTTRAMELVALTKDGLPEENFEFPKVGPIEPKQEVAEGIFPEEALPLLVVLIQGRYVVHTICRDTFKFHDAD
jgi:hypothetical protein